MLSVTNLCMCLCACACVYANGYMHVCVCVSVCVCVHVVCVSVCVCVHVSVSVCACAYANGCMHVCVCVVRVCARACVNMLSFSLVITNNMGLRKESTDVMMVIFRSVKHHHIISNCNVSVCL